MRSIITVIALILSVNIVFAGDKSIYQGDVIEGPYNHKNLSIFLIHGKNKVDADNIITLDEAIERKIIVVHETGNVEKLSVENKGDVHVFIQAGDIIKGGRQDRILRSDLVVKPKSGKIPVASFCVEQGRWSQRGNEKAGQFSSSKKAAVSKKLKLATKQAELQSDVWSEVAVMQKKLGSKLGESVKSNESSSSLQLSLENKELGKKSKEYIKALQDIPKGKHDVIGFAFAINGVMNSTDIYGHTALFKKLWKKMLESCSVEAISEYEEKKQIKKPTPEMVVAWLKESEKIKKEQERIMDDLTFRIKESDENVQFETYDKGYTDGYIHKNVIKK